MALAGSQGWSGGVCGGQRQDTSAAPEISLRFPDPLLGGQVCWGRMERVNLITVDLHVKSSLETVFVYPRRGSGSK